MNIVVCIKQVPDTTEIKIDPVKNTLIRKGVPSILNPFDKNALEQALRLKDQYGATVTAISMGPDNAKEVLREALSMGADKAYLVTDRAFGGSDTYATSYILSKAIEKLGPFDFVLVGKQAIDGDTGQTGSSIAEHLKISRLSYVLDIKMEGQKCVVKRQVEEGAEIVETKLPVLCTLTKESNKPRYATIKGKIDSLKAEIGEIHLDDIKDIDTTKIGLKGSPTRVKATFTPKRQASGEVMKVVNPEKTAKELVGKLLEAKLV
ncbi:MULTISPECIES: electron transfer flavoprotein subunit beta/FixA family protein [Clostridium]|uniref:Electron transfer flavoprotein small subunit n=3 Tax=Clostridium TaxID=1485 RepID=D8GUT8_CLOLD|nr:MULTISPECIES: electron transfer flavoprotein subunit beta/FixA family protein [Clostridium]ADK16965.1 electron transfer flavoprotein beta subunit [Clostridium ljungdahlii DSM 13528]OAA85342.1 Acryloyl-CoA reductase electron transfer subunit gamma [Clostridium ljungdahlii DSM 13528]OAA90170.1 Acryloyl-CoA reductase electron transfer subunit gamma [Clostridium coskatii]OBR91052.1 acryloyl-CoA reductase electron transfer subunit gamma [Clostridium coskatii]RMD04443.1 electron transfer flavopro